MLPELKEKIAAANLFLGGIIRQLEKTDNTTHRIHLLNALLAITEIKNRLVAIKLAYLRSQIQQLSEEQIALLETELILAKARGQM